MKITETFKSSVELDQSTAVDERKDWGSIFQSPYEGGRGVHRTKPRKYDNKVDDNSPIDVSNQNRSYKKYRLISKTA